MVRVLRLLLALATTLGTAGVCAGDWYEYQSENFTVYSDVPEQRVNVLMKDLERFRRAALSFTGQEEIPENRNLRVFHFRESAEFERFTNDRKIAGLYRETWEGPIIFSRDGGHGITGSGLIFHEYVHHLMRERSGMTYPRWYSEGFAELLASAELRKKDVIVGGLPEWRLGAWADDDPLTIEQLLAPPPLAAQNGEDNSRYWNNYYASAWLFTHYLQLGHNAGHPDYRAATTNYLKAVAAGEHPSGIFEEHFGRSIKEMQRELLAYMRDEIQRHKLHIPEYQYSIPRRALSVNECLFLLADEAMDFDKPQLAMDYLKRSEQQSLGWQENFTTMAVIDARDKKFKHGEKAVKEIGEHGQVSHLTAVNLAQYFLLRLQALSLTREWNEEFYEQAVKYGKIAVQMGPDYLPGYRTLWTAYQLKGKSEEALQIMQAAYQQEPNHLNLNAAIGFYLVHLGKNTLAREYLERVVAWSHSDQLRSDAQALLERGE
ncbi:tetratricopeptide repeat protein [Microbulbifer pacificus]|uniref:tetratricopeptide repeat protein n=1 Tax=Microbulbifer pacificus TaxID=407164 RepID=UPI000CF3AC7F|nr:tetratricopeptide repeat protein [Microbulbifer pacificus]